MFFFLDMKNSNYMDNLINLTIDLFARYFISKNVLDIFLFFLSCVFCFYKIFARRS